MPAADISEVAELKMAGIAPLEARVVEGSVCCACWNLAISARAACACGPCNVQVDVYGFITSHWLPFLVV